MANVAKYKAAGCGHMFKHYERAKELNKETGEMEYVKFKNQDIDSSRTHLNYNLAPKKIKEDGTEMSQLEILHQRLKDKDVYYRKRKDTNVMCSCVITKPKTLPAEESERFFKTAYKALAARYGEDNIISAYVHRDENEDHMHFAFVPVVYDVKKKRLTVSAKMKVSKTDLQTLHPYLTEQMKKEFGYDVGVENGVTKEGNLTTDQLKKQTQKAKKLEKENQLLESKIIGLNSHLEELRSDRDDLIVKNNKLQNDNEALRSEQKVLVSKIETTIKNKEEYDKAVDEITNSKTGFLNIVLEVLSELREAFNKPADVWEKAVSKFEFVIDAVENKILNLLGHEIKSDMPKEERKSEGIQNIIDDAISRSKIYYSEKSKENVDIDREIQ